MTDECGVWFGLPQGAPRRRKTDHPGVRRPPQGVPAPDVMMVDDLPGTWAPITEKFGTGPEHPMSDGTVIIPVTSLRVRYDDGADWAAIITVEGHIVKQGHVDDMRAELLDILMIQSETVLPEGARFFAPDHFRP